MRVLQTITRGDGPSFVSHTGIAAPFLRPNVDTDVIMPLNRRGASANLSPGEICFESIRYLVDGSENPDFILNRQPYREASILLAGDNFGTGSAQFAGSVAPRETSKSTTSLYPSARAALTAVCPRAFAPSTPTPNSSATLTASSVAASISA